MIRMDIRNGYITVNESHDKIIISVSGLNLDDVILTCENAGLPGIIGPDIDYNVGELVANDCNQAREDAFDPKNGWQG
jgi:hypothetical protein